METTLRTINAVISALFFICYTYQFLYIPLVLASKSPKALASPAKGAPHAVLIAARNEENVISGLLDSLRAQTYDMSQVTVFVAADNCTDQHRRHRPRSRRGGIRALQPSERRQGATPWTSCSSFYIGADYPAGFDGCALFDADNIPRPGLHKSG